MAKIDDGGPAFPNPALANEAFMPSCDLSGLTKRDWFAAQMLPRIGSGWPNSENRKIIAEQAYEMADAMITESQKGGEA